jgi:hypothetical protein
MPYITKLSNNLVLLHSDKAAFVVNVETMKITNTLEETAVGDGVQY